MKVKFTVPTSKEQITISQYQELERVRELNEDSDDGAFLIEKMVSIFCDVDMKDLRHIQYDHYERIVDELNKAFDHKPKHKQVIEIDGQKFGMIPNFDKMSFGEYVDLDEYVKTPADHHKFMAVLYRPITSTIKDAYSIEPYEGSEKYASIMKYASVADLEGALVFLEFSQRIVRDYESLFTGGVDENKYSDRANFGRKYGWYQPIVALAGDDITRIGEVVKLNIHECLYKLQFDKERMDIEQREIEATRNRKR